MPFAKVIGPVKEIGLKGDFPWFLSWFEDWYFLSLNTCKTKIFCFHVFKREIYQGSNQEKIVKTFIKHRKHINGKITSKWIFLFNVKHKKLACKERPSNVKDIPVQF